MELASLCTGLPHCARGSPLPSCWLLDSVGDGTSDQNRLVGPLSPKGAVSLLFHSECSCALPVWGRHADVCATIKGEMPPFSSVVQRGDGDQRPSDQDSGKPSGGGNRPARRGPVLAEEAAKAAAHRKPQPTTGQSPQLSPLWPRRCELALTSMAWNWVVSVRDPDDSCS